MILETKNAGTDQAPVREAPLTEEMLQLSEREELERAERANVSLLGRLARLAVPVGAVGGLIALGISLAGRPDSGVPVAEVTPGTPTPTAPVSPEPPVTAAAPEEEGQEPMQGGVQPGVAAETTPSPMPSPTPSPSPEAAASEPASAEPVKEEPKETPPTPLPAVTLPPSPMPPVEPTEAAPPFQEPVKSPEQLRTEARKLLFAETGFWFHESEARFMFPDGTKIWVETPDLVREILRRLKEPGGGYVDGVRGVGYQHRDGKFGENSAYGFPGGEGFFTKFDANFGKFLLFRDDNTFIEDAWSDQFLFFFIRPAQLEDDVQKLNRGELSYKAQFDRALDLKKAHQARLAANRPPIRPPLARQQRPV